MILKRRRWGWKIARYPISHNAGKQLGVYFEEILKSRALDFMLTSERVSRKRKGKREYLNDAETKRMMKELNDFFEKKIDIHLIRYVKRQRVETLINEEALLLAKYLRDENYNWIPRVISNTKEWL